jgi:hypothetical protein
MSHHLQLRDARLPESGIRTLLSLEQCLISTRSSNGGVVA